MPACGLPSARGHGVAVPGFVDLQVNGFGGIDFLDADTEGYRRAGEALLETGVTAYLPTLISSPEEQVLAALREVPTGAAYPRILGVHLEGPFLSPSRLGAHPESARRDPDLDLLDRLLDAGPVRLMTLAPELPGAGQLIERLRARDITVSLGHSDATAEEAETAFDLGVRTVTHLFNAMRPFLHRDPGIVGAALARDDVIVQLIVDGPHLAPETVQVVWRAAAGRVALVTDSIAAAGESDGAYSLGTLDVTVHDGAVHGPDGVLAGSVLTMVEAVQNLHALGVPLDGRGRRGHGGAGENPRPARARPPGCRPTGRHRDPRRQRRDRPGADRRQRSRSRGGRRGLHRRLAAERRTDRTRRAWR